MADLETGKISRRAPKNIAARRGYYALPDRPDLPPQPGGGLAREDRVRHRAGDREAQGGDLKLGGQDWAELHFFMAFLSIRVPAFRDNIEDSVGRVVKQIGR